MIINLLKSIRNILIAVVVIIAALLAAGTSFAFYNQKTAIDECVESYGQGSFSQVHWLNEEDFINNCETIQDRAKELLKGWGDTTTPVFITPANETYCGVDTVGCVTKSVIGGLEINIMSIATNTDYFLTLEHTVAHEYIHVLTNKEEMELLDAHPEIWEGVEPWEAVADCGLPHFLPAEIGGLYLSNCSEKQKELAYKVITNTLTKEDFNFNIEEELKIKQLELEKQALEFQKTHEIALTK